MKKIAFLLLLVVMAANGYSQSMADLDREPSFKGITIGAPISKYSNILKYNGVRNGKNTYTITDQQYYSIFNIKMKEAVVVESEGKVWAIVLGKSNGAEVFNPKELEVLRTSLTAKYGSPNVDLTDISGSPSVAGFRWQANNIVLDITYLFHGTMEGSDLRYYLHQRKDDY